MNATPNPERGQALVIIAFGLIALVAMVGLAIDGGSVYSERRRAQNAADTAVMAAGLSRIRNPLSCGNPASTSLCTAAFNAGMAQALENGYDDATSNDVQLVQCNDPGANCALPASESYVDENSNGQYDAGEPFNDLNSSGARDQTIPVEFLQAKIHSDIPTYFARVLGITQLSNTVEALAKAVPPMPTNWYNGRALIALMPGCKPSGWPSDPFVLGGNADVVLNGSGVYVNSTCQPAFEDGGNSNSMVVNGGGICVRGTSTSTDGINPPPTENCASEGSTQLYQMPAVDLTTCTVTRDTIPAGAAPGEYVASPGTYEYSFPGSYVGPGNKITFLSGVYCLKDGFTVNAGWTVTTDVDGIGAFDGSDLANEGALFYVHSGGVSFNGNSTARIGAMNNPSTHPAVKGYLIYLPPENDSTVSLNGTNGTTFVGTILAPSSHVDISGGLEGDTLTYEAQIIGFTLNITGSGTLRMNYYQSQNGTAWTSPVLKLYR